MKTIKKAIENYNAPTPIKWRRIGNLIHSIGTTISGITLFTLPEYVTIIALLLTRIGKIITDFHK